MKDKEGRELETRMLDPNDIEASELNNIRPYHADDPQTLNLKRSIQSQGFYIHRPVVVTPKLDPETNQITPDKWTLCDGNHRREIAKELGLTEIPCVIYPNMTPEEMQQMQYMLNTNVPTKPKEKYEHFRRYMLDHPHMSQQEIADFFCMSQSEFSRLMGYGKLTEPIQKKIDKGEITASVGLALAKVPSQHQDQLCKQIQKEDLPSGEAIEFIAAQRKAINKAIREDTDTVETVTPKKFVGLSEAKAMLEQVERVIANASPDTDEFVRLSGEVSMAQRMLCCDPEYLANKDAARTAKKEQSKLEAAKKKLQKQQDEIAKLQKEVDEAAATQKEESLA